MPTESALQLDAAGMAAESIRVALMKAAVNVIEMPRKRGPAPFPPRLIEEKPKTPGGAVILYIRDGKHEESTYATLDRREDAETRLQFYVLKKAARARAIVEPRKTRVLLALDRLLEAERPDPGASDYTWREYRAMAARLGTLTAFFEHKTFGELDKATCKDFIKWRTNLPDARYRPDNPDAPKAKAATAGVDISTLRKAIKLFASELDLSWSPTVYIPKTESKRQRHMKRSELARMMWAVRGRIWNKAKGGWLTETVIDENGRAVERRVIRPIETREARRVLTRFIFLGYHTGTRHAALRELSWIASSEVGCLDVDGKVIHRRGFGEDPFKGKPRHTSKIAAKVAARARRWRDTDLANGIEHVIHQPDGSPYRARISFIWACVVADAGLDDEVVPHALRHTAATHLRIIKIDPRAAADLLGMSVQTAMRHYAHWTLEGQDDAADALAYGKGLKGSIVLEGAPTPQPPKAEPPAPVDDDQFSFDFGPIPAPEPEPEVVEQLRPALPIPTGPFQPVEPIVPPPPKLHPTHARRTERRTRAKLGVAARGRVGFAPVPRLPNQATPPAS